MAKNKKKATAPEKAEAKAAEKEVPAYAAKKKDAPKKDKKAESGKIHFVLPKAIGQVEIVDLTVEEVCRLMA